MSLLDAYRKKLEAQIQEHKAQLDLLKARAKSVAATGLILSYDELAEADKHLETAKAKFKELKGSGGSALKEIKSGVKQALADLKISTKKAAQHFNAPPPPANPPAEKPASPAAAVKARARSKPAKSAKVPRHTKSRGR
jgi:signal transduction histidine kinase